MSNIITQLKEKLALDSQKNREGLKKNIPIEFPSDLANPFMDIYAGA